MADSVVTQFVDLSTQLIREAVEYSGKGERDPETESNIRQIRTMANALLAALSVTPLPPAAVAAAVR